MTGKIGGFIPGDRVRIRPDQLQAFCSRRNRERIGLRVGTITRQGFQNGSWRMSSAASVYVLWDGCRAQTQIAPSWLEKVVKEGLTIEPATTG